jgi:hypothetical protein
LDYRQTFAILAVAGFRVFHMLAGGKTLYIDDLATDGDNRSSRLGSALFEWAAGYARTLVAIP